VKRFGEIFLLILIFITVYSTNILAGEISYTVKAGDSLWKIAEEHGVTVDYLIKINCMASDKLQIGDTLILHADDEYKQNAAQKQTSTESYIVQSGDCLGLIAEKFGISVDVLMQMNNISSQMIKVGQELKVSGSAGIQKPFEEPTAVNTSIYTVQTGDCLAGIARKYLMNVSQLKSINGLSDDVIFPGEQMQVYTAPAGDVSRSGSISDKQRILETSFKYLGVPYVWGGASPSGFDCSGYVQYIYKQCGYQLPRTAGAQYQNGIAVDRANLIEGDLVFFACHSSSIDHVGIYTGNKQFIHASSPRSGGVIVTSMEENFYLRAYIGARRIVR